MRNNRLRILQLPTFGLIALLFSVGFVTTGWEVQAADVQTKCNNPQGTQHFKTLGPDDKFCSECRERTDYGHYLDALAEAVDAEKRNNKRAAAEAFVNAAKRRVNASRKAVALVGAGRNLVEAEDFENAAKEIEKARRLDSKIPEAALLLGRVEFVRKNWSQATALFEEANKLAGKASYAALWLGEIAYAARNYSEAAEQYAIAEPENGESFVLAYHYAVALRSLNRVADSIPRFERARTLEPLEFDPVFALAEIYNARRQYKEAAAMWGRAGDLKPSTAEYHLKQAATYVILEDYDNAYTAYRVVIGRDPKSFEALVGMATIEVMQGKLRDAELHLDSAVKVRPDDLQAALLYGMVKDIRDTRKEAVVVASEAVDRAPAWHPAGMRLAFQSTREKDSHIFTMVIGAKPEKLTTTGQNFDPAWSADGKEIAFHSRRGNNDIYMVDVATKRERRLTTDSADDETPSFTPDGKRIVFMSKRASNKKWGIYTMALDGSDVQPLIVDRFNNESAKFNFNGSQVVFVSDRSGKKKVWVANADGSAPRMLNDNGDEEGYPCWSPDGKKIAYCTLKSADWTVWTVDATGANRQRLDAEFSQSQLEPAWNPNGVRILTSFIIKTRAAGTTDAYGSPISGGMKSNYEIKVQLAPGR